MSRGTFLVALSPQGVIKRRSMRGGSPLLESAVSSQALEVCLAFYPLAQHDAGVKVILITREETTPISSQGERGALLLGGICSALCKLSLMSCGLRRRKKKICGRGIMTCGMIYFEIE